jgi:hypothetical protein
MCSTCKENSLTVQAQAAQLQHAAGQPLQRLRHLRLVCTVRGMLQQCRWVRWPRQFAARRYRQQRWWLIWSQLLSSTDDDTGKKELRRSQQPLPFATPGHRGCAGLPANLQQRPLPTPLTCKEEGARALASCRRVASTAAFLGPQVQLKQRKADTCGPAPTKSRCSRLLWELQKRTSQPACWHSTL